VDKTSCGDGSNQPEGPEDEQDDSNGVKHDLSFECSVH
jgi:hypothetical protein